jgi:hypothetical protein
VSPYALVWWAILIALAIILVLSVAQALRAWREIERLGDRVAALADLSVVAALERAAVDGRRIDAAIGEMPALLERANAAVVVIRRGPLPVELVGAILRVRSEIAAFRKFAGR